MIAYSSSQRPRRSFLHRGLSLIGWCGILGAIGVSGLGLTTYAAPEIWLADNMSFFLRQFLAAGLAGCLGGLLALLATHRFPRLYKGLLLVAVGLLICLALLTGLRTLANTVSPAPLPADADRVKVVSINLESLYLGDRTLQQFLEGADADVLIFQEAAWWLQKRRWQRLGLPEDGTGVPGLPAHRYVGELGGVVLFSRLPIVAAQTETVKGRADHGENLMYVADREIVGVTLQTENSALQIVAVHPDSPRTESRWLNKREYFQALDKTLARQTKVGDGNVLVVGDWNTSAWSGHFQDLLGANGLRTAYPDGWPQTTRFFFDYRLHWILGAAVDQFAITPGIAFGGVSLGPNIGSDHLPLMIELGIRKNLSTDTK